MPEADKHADGSFCWIELGTSDQSGAKNFYTGLFGWTSEDSPMGPDGVYTMFRIKDRSVGAAYTQRAEETSMGVPPHWNLYIAVSSADDAARKASEGGGKVLAGPFDVSNLGRMAVIQDPTGAVFSIWQARDNIGSEVEREPGSLCWADLNTGDQATALKFYGDLFGWTTTPGAGGYLHLKNGEEFIGGIPSAQQGNPNVPPHWMIYMQVDDCAASTAKGKELGGAVFMGPMRMEKTGVMSIIADPQGAAFALFEPLPRE